MGIDVIMAWSLALVPVLVLTGVFIWLDVFKLMSRWEILGLLLAGGVVAVFTYPLSGAFLDTLPIGFNNYSRFVAPWLEEALKAIVIITLGSIRRWWTASRRRRRGRTCCTSARGGAASW